MGFQSLLKGYYFLLFIFSYVTSQSTAVTLVDKNISTIEGSVFIDGKSSIAKTDEDFICATLDWWPPEKCDYGRCSWDHSSLINLDLDNNILLNAVKAFSPLKLRLGGTLQDKVIYDTDENHEPCNQFVKNTTEMFSFTKGCLHMDRWDELNAFFKKSGARIIFGLNALTGRSIQSDGSAAGNWNYSNAKSFISYTVKKNYSIYAWELGNELCGSGVGTRVAADQYALDTISLHDVVQNIYSDIEPKPLILSPGGFFEENWFKEFINRTGDNVDALTHHIYNLGPGSDPRVLEKILDPSYLDNAIDSFSKLESTLKSSATSATAWVGESGGAYNSGRNGVSNAFVYSFWYLDQLGMSAVYDTKTYCRQTLIGGNYGLLDTTTFVPNPDYYSALLWHKLMGTKVLSTNFSGTKKIRAYAHCAKESTGITLLLINLDKNTTVQVQVTLNNKGASHHNHRHHKHRSFISHRSNKTRVIQLPEGAAASTRDEYHLTAKDGDLQSRRMLLNGKILNLNSDGDIPTLDPMHVNSSEPITVAPFSIVFVHLPYLLPACK
ncbi:heparanase-like protein 3 [Mercurialis annua]|uniref:heparanase-like protein 3 n=1 Tax=Mercurialis annua TaxID=3986 RepID=UPI002160EB1A|nr:heparanase-like protein 3 [Mercurialis annua]